MPALADPFPPAVGDKSLCVCVCVWSEKSVQFSFGTLGCWGHSNNYIQWDEIYLLFLILHFYGADSLLYEWHIILKPFCGRIILLLGNS